MKFSEEQSKVREEKRNKRREMKNIYPFFAFRPSFCEKCGTEFQFEFGYRRNIKKWGNVGSWSYSEDLCNGCAPSKERAWEIFFKEKTEEKK